MFSKLIERWRGGLRSLFARGVGFWFVLFSALSIPAVLWGAIPFSAGLLYIFPDEVNRVGVMSAAITTCLLVILYSFVVHRKVLIEVDEGRRETWVDTVYFLGFVFTLVALVFGLFGRTEGTDPSSLLSQNAIALSSTVIGIIVRTVFHLNIRQDAPSQREEHVAAQLMKGLQEVSGTLNKIRESVSEINSSTRLDAVEELEAKIASLREKMEALDYSIAGVDARFRELNINEAEVSSAVKRLVHTTVDELLVSLDGKRQEISEHAANVSAEFLTSWEHIFSEISQKIELMNREVSQYESLAPVSIPSTPQKPKGFWELVADKLPFRRKAASEDNDDRIAP